MREQLRRWWPVAAVLAALVAVSLITASAAQDGVPLDPESTGPQGTAALVAVLERLGADVVVAERPRDLLGADALLLLRDPSGPAGQQAAWSEAVDDVLAAGGVVVVTDPASPRTPPTADVFDVPVDAPRCDLAAVSGLDPVRTGSTAYERPSGAVGCYPAGEDADWLVAVAEGPGVVVGLGDADVWTNARIDQARHAELAVGLLAPREAAAPTVAVVGPLVAAAAADGGSGLLDLLPDPVRLALIQALLALLMVVAWRARRLGGPVAEPIPVVLPAADVVAATGALLGQSGARAAAAAAVSDALRRDLASRLGLPPDADPARVAADALALGLDPDTVLAAVRPGPVADDPALVRHTRLVASVRERGLGSASGAPPGEADGEAAAPDRPASDPPPTSSGTASSGTIDTGRTGALR